jgi:glycosyltransferase involved in cell wall biosynthesis
MASRQYKIVYCTPALYFAGGMERVLTQKANYFADHFGYDITIILTDGKDKPLFYPLSDKVKVVNLNIGFEELWTCSFFKKIFIYLRKQSQYKRLLKEELMRIRPDITVSMLRREINFINDIKDGSKKIGEIHINRANFRNFESNDENFIKKIFAKVWMNSLLQKLKRLDRFVVLTEKDKEAWVELDNVYVIPNPLSFAPQTISKLTEKRIIAVGRYSHEKGYDLLLKTWSIVQDRITDWRLEIFGEGDRSQYDRMVRYLNIDRHRCVLNGRSDNIQEEFINSSLAVCSSKFEGFGLVITEAMVCGLPVVSFDCPWGPRAIINDGEDGLLIENGNVEKLAEALVEMVQHPEKLRRMAAKAVENVQRFKIDQIAEKWKSIFDALYE